MNRLLTTIILILLLGINIFAKTNIQGIASKGGLVIQTSPTVSYKTIQSFPSCTITVYITGTTNLAIIYSDNAGTLKSNPFTANSDASFSFYADNGRYDVKLSGTGITTPFTPLVDVVVKDANEDNYSPTNYGALCDGVTLDTINFSSMISDIGSTKATIRLPKSPCRLASFSFPSNTTIDYGNSGGLYADNNTTVITIIGPQVPSAPTDFLVQRYYNLLGSISNQGTLSISGNKSISGMYPEWFGGKGDKSTENGYAIQAIINIFAAASKNPSLYLGEGVYNDGIPFQDASLSNAQIVLPKVNNNQSMLTVKIKGVAAPAHPWNTDSGSIIRSTLTSGTGNIIGVKNNQGSFCTTATCVASNISSNIIVDFQDVTFRAVANPTYSAVDISRIRNAYLNSVRVDTNDFGAGGLNPHFFPGTNIPDPICTEPTTSTSYGIKLPTDYLTNRVVTNDIFVAGYYNQMRVGELGKGERIVFHCGKVGFAVEGATWPNHFQNVVMAAIHTPIKALGATPELAGYPDTNLTSRIVIDDLGVENDVTLGWTGVNYLVDDANGYLIGWAKVFYGAGVALPDNRSLTDNKFEIYRTEFPWNGIDPNGLSSYLTGDYAVDETYRGKQVSTDNALGWKIVGCNQLGTNNGCGVFGAANHAIAPGIDNRLSFLYFTTDGAINNGKITIFVMKNGVSTVAGTIDRYGNLSIVGMFQTGVANLTITSNTITPITPLVTIPVGNIDNITVPPNISSATCFDAIPTGAYTYSAIGNVGVPAGGGLAVVGRLMRFCYNGNTGKWNPSY